jgi:hypothetical protein
MRNRQTVSAHKGHACSNHENCLILRGGRGDLTETTNIGSASQTDGLSTANAPMYPGDHSTSEMNERWDNRVDANKVLPEIVTSTYAL